MFSQLNIFIKQTILKILIHLWFLWTTLNRWPCGSATSLNNDSFTGCFLGNFGTFFKGIFFRTPLYNHYFFSWICVLNRIIFTISASRSLFYQQDLTDLAEAKANNRSLLFAWKYFIYCNIYFSLFSFDRIAFCLPMVNLCFNIIKCESSVEGSDWNQIEKFPVLKVRW